MVNVVVQKQALASWGTHADEDDDIQDAESKNEPSPSIAAGKATTHLVNAPVAIEYMMILLMRVSVLWT